MDKVSISVVIDWNQKSCRLLEAVHLIIAYHLLLVKARLKLLLSEELR